MNGNTIFTVIKGNKERVTLPDKKSMQDLMYALNVLDCYEQLGKQEISGNRQDLEIYEVTFLDKAIKVVGQTDAQKVIDWMLTYGCTKVGIEKLGVIKNDRED
jgi:hypothetical protein